MTEQPRQPAGSETGGQFLTVAREEAPVNLALAPKGSFLYPPILHTPDEAIAFWESVEIPDDAIARTASQYVAQWQAVVDHQPGLYWDMTERWWLERNPQPTDPALVPAWEQERVAARDTFVTEMGEGLRARPEFLDPRDARVAAKAIGLLETARDMPDAESSYAVLDHLVETTSGWQSVDDLGQFWGLSYISASVTDAPSYDVSALESRIVTEMQRQLAHLRAAQEREHSEVISEFGTVADNTQKSTGMLIDVISPRGRRG